MSILLSFKHLHLNFGDKVIFNNAELTINKGDKIGLIGLNGQGKSTLFNILTKKVTPDISKPAFLFNETNEQFDICHIPQELDINSFPELNIENFFLSFYPELLKINKLMQDNPEDMDLLEEFDRLGGWNIQSNYLNYLKSFDLHDLSAPISQLSGGERKKIALSIGLSSQAEVILWDEPTNHLDIETIERFEDDLINSPKTYMIISHDRYLLNHTTKRICHIERGEITNFKGTYLDYLEYLDNRELELKKNLEKLENRQRRELAWMRQGIKARGTRSKKRVEKFDDLNKEISSFRARAAKKASLNLDHSNRKTKILLQAKNATFSYENKPIFKDVSFMITKKDKIALIGPNGAGKSTLISLLKGDHKFSDGHFKSAENLKILVFDQHRSSLDESKTPKELLGEGSDYIIFDNGTKKHINSYMADFLFTSNQVNRSIETLSGGEKNRLQLAMFMKQSADIWVFDEPTNDLDIETIELLEQKLSSYQAAVIIIGHDRAFLDKTCKSTWLINDLGIEKFQGGYTQVAPYLHALEKQKREAVNKPNETPKPIEKNKTKLSYSESKRLEEIEVSISEMEKIIAKLEAKVCDFDFNNMDQDTQSKYNEINKLKLDCQNKIDDLFLEWENISNS